jgi:DNA (cytosine-5)-methyltransferase 1
MRPPLSEVAPAFTVVSTFAGCGGSSLGYKMAGGKCLLAIEWDEHAVAVYRANFPATPVWAGDIKQLTAEEVMRLAGIQAGELGLLDGSPPCQGFSTAGSRVFNDSRNSLFHEYVRLLRALQPKAFLMENVAGMVKGKMKLVFAEAMRELKKGGYDVRCRLLNAMYFGVPQSRERVIFIGVRSDLNIPASHPRPCTRPITVREAFCGLADVPDERVRLGPQHKTYQQMMRVAPGERDPRHFSHHRLHWDRPAPTIDRGGGAGAYHVWHPAEHRPITVSELKRLGGFPDGFKLTGALNEQFARVGNSVPPPLSKALAEHLIDTVFRPIGVVNVRC